jgi:manganese/zinc/iron transport system permease protein
MGLIAGSAALALLISQCLFKELTLLCFDQQYLSTQGYPLSWLDGVLMALVVMIAITGMQAVGLILVIALLIVPAAAARFWTHQIRRQVLIAATLGAAGCFVGSVISALIPNLPAGAVIILVCVSLFLLSAAFGYRQGLLWRMWRRREWQSGLARQHLLRGIYERLEMRPAGEVTGANNEGSVTIEELLSLRSWNRRTVEQVVDRSQRAGLVTRIDGRVWLSKSGWLAARRLTHQHRLWELYLITHADVALQQVDRLADDIEHVLEPAVIEELEEILQQRGAMVADCPHRSSESV